MEFNSGFKGLNHCCRGK